MTPEPRKLRLHRTLLLAGGSAYLVWWAFVRLALPQAFNPLGSRLAVVACFLAVFAASGRSRAIARHLDVWLGICASILTAHYFYLFDRNNADLNWVVGSYITVIAVCAILQTSRALLLYSFVVVVIAAVMLFRQPGVTYAVFLPGILTSLVFANVGLHGRLRLLARLEESHDRIERLFDAGFEGIAVHEAGVIRLVNGVLGPLLGYTREELLGRDLPTLFVPDARDTIAAMVAGKQVGAFETTALRKDGSRMTVEVLGKPHVLEGRPMQQLAVRDLTERKRAETALVRVNRDLEAFSYSVAHDLRTPLRAIGGFSQVLLEDYGDRLDDEGKRYLARIDAAAEMMGSLIDALLGLARLTRTGLRKEKVDLTACARTVARELAETHPGRPVDFLAEDGVLADGDPQLLKVVLDNLLGNAWKFTAKVDSPEVRFGTTFEEGQTVYYVKDNGAGFDMTYVDKLFGPFQRLHTKVEYPGTGIGLATVQRIIERHGGRVWADGAVDGGATFSFTLDVSRPVSRPAPRLP